MVVQALYAVYSSAHAYHALVWVKQIFNAVWHVFDWYVCFACCVFCCKHNLSKIISSYVVWIVFAILLRVVWCILVLVCCLSFVAVLSFFTPPHNHCCVRFRKRPKCVYMNQLCWVFVAGVHEASRKRVERLLRHYRAETRAEQAVRAHRVVQTVGHMIAIFL